jgi:hypothetical protein
MDTAPRSSGASIPGHAPGPASLPSCGSPPTRCTSSSRRRALRSPSDVATKAASRKPLDVGNGLLAASFAPSGAWLSLSAFHPRHGTVELTNMPPFDERHRGDAEAVRAYRGAMTDERHAFLFVATDGARVSRVERGRDGVPEVEQVWRLEAPDDAPRAFELRFGGAIRPPALAEITEVSPLPPVASSTSLAVDGLRLRLEAPELPASARVAVELDGGTSDGWAPDGGEARLVVGWSRRLEVTIRATLAGEARPVHTGTRAAPRFERRGRLWCDDLGLRVASRHREGLERIARGAVAYVAGCTLLRTGPGEACLLTDHRLLPLSWTRDAYYQALLLLTAGADEPSYLDLVADHLRWLWGRCERPGHLWQRSHRANGEPKDLAYQADQQLFPVLELLDFRQATGAWPAPPPGDPTAEPCRTWGALVDAAWRALPVSPNGLVRTDENPADDPSSLPFALSAQVLAWYVARRLADVAAELGLDSDLLHAARRARVATDREFCARGTHGMQWAYEVDGQGGSRLYADANDVPTALAAAWGFCAADDPVWGATMRFAFDEANPAFRPGPWGGLGSLHTPGTWPLGDAQEWVVASAVGDVDRAERALGRLTGIAASDGLLPEAYDPETGAWTARHWFAWPAALVGALAGAALHG